MFCTYCNTTRAANEAPCPNCGAPSPFLGRPANNNTWNQNPAPTDWGNLGPQSYTQGENQIPQLSFENPANAWQTTSNQQSPFPSWQQSENEQIPMSSWQQGSSTHEQLPAQERFPEKQSFLPVPYQNNMPAQIEERQSTMALQLIPNHAMEHLLPAMTQAPEALYVAPMYTKPRPLIPRYRAISGLISVIIVTLLLCGGAGYYAKTSGRLHGLSILLGRSQLANTQPTTVPILQNPPQQTANDTGPAANIINSATTTSAVDSVTGLARDGQKVFQPGQTFYVAFHINATTTGKIYARWYTNNIYYRQTDASSTVNGFKNASMNMVYALATNGTVEIYWNGQLAQRLYFVVRN